MYRHVFEYFFIHLLLVFFNWMIDMDTNSVLFGIKILDLTMLAPGPYATMILGDLGADIIKIESPNKLDPIRNRPPLLNKEGEEVYGAYHSNLNRNKRSLTLNLKSEEGKTIFYKLAKNCDVIIEGFRPDVKKRLKIDYEIIKEINPKIIYCSVTGFGQEGLYYNDPGHDLNYIGLSGSLYLTSKEDSKPIIPSVQVADFGGALCAVISILSALIARNNYQVGQFIDLALIDVSFSWMIGIYNNFFHTKQIPIPSNERLTGGHPGYNIYKTKDGKFISLCALEPKFWENLFNHFKKSEYLNQESIIEKKEEIYSFLKEIFLKKTRDEWIKELKDLEVCICPVLQLNEVMNHPQIKIRKIFKEFDHPNFGKQIQILSPINLSETPIQIRNKAPFLGENSEEILLELGYSKEEIKYFRKNNVI
ncbi:MAG: CoA transferase [Candidatus Lokiarchaeota archaeon]|nr:CoA transferase [Candidatus Lokiarchaeota archaeon]